MTTDLSVTPIARIASATGVPCATRTSTWRSFATISSGVCLFLPIVILLRLSRAILQDGPLQRGRIIPLRRLPLSRRGHQPRRVALLPVPAQPTHGGRDAGR